MKEMPQKFLQQISQLEKVKEYIDSMKKSVCNLHLFNAIISDKMYDAFDLLDEEKIEGKYLWEDRKRCETLWNNYIKKLKEAYSKETYSFLYDFSNNFYKSLSKDYTIFYLSVLKVFSNHNLKRKEILAHLSCALIAADIAVEAFDIFFGKYNNLIGIDVSKGYRYMRLDKLKLNLKRVQNEVFKREDSDNIDLTEDAQCQAAYETLLNNLSSDNYLDTALQTTYQLNSNA